MKGRKKGGKERRKEGIEQKREERKEKKGGREGRRKGGRKREIRAMLFHGYQRREYFECQVLREQRQVRTLLKWTLHRTKDIGCPYSHDGGREEGPGERDVLGPQHQVG